MPLFVDWRFFWLSGWFLGPALLAFGVAAGWLMEKISLRWRPTTPADLKRDALIGKWAPRLLYGAFALSVIGYLIQRYG